MSVPLEKFRARFDLSADLLKAELIGLDGVAEGVEGAVEGQRTLHKHFVPHHLLSNDTLELFQVPRYLLLETVLTTCYRFLDRFLCCL